MKKEEQIKTANGDLNLLYDLAYEAGQDYKACCESELARQAERKEIVEKIRSIKKSYVYDEYEVWNSALDKVLKLLKD